MRVFERLKARIWFGMLGLVMKQWYKFSKRRVSVETLEAVKKSFVKSFHFIKDHSVQTETVQIFIDLLHFLADVSPLMFHCKETVPDHYKILGFFY